MRQEFDYAGVEGRLLSSSYAPGPDHPQHRAHAARIAPHLRCTLPSESRAAFEYKTRLYFGRLS